MTITPEERVFYHFWDMAMPEFPDGPALEGKEEWEIGYTDDPFNPAYESANMHPIDKRTFVTTAVSEGMTAYDALNFYYALDLNDDQHLDAADLYKLKIGNNIGIIVDTYKTDPNKWRHYETNLGRPSGQDVAPLSGAARAGEEKWYVHLSPYEAIARDGNPDDALAAGFAQAGVPQMETQQAFLEAYARRLDDLAGDDGQMDAVALNLHGVPGTVLPLGTDGKRMHIPAAQVIEPAADCVKPGGVVSLRSCDVGAGLLDANPDAKTQALKTELLDIAHRNGVYLRVCTKPAWTGVYGSGAPVLITPDGQCIPDPTMAAKMADYRAELTAELKTLGYAP